MLITALSLVNFETLVLNPQVLRPEVLATVPSLFIANTF